MSKYEVNQERKASNKYFFSQFKNFADNISKLWDNIKGAFKPRTSKIFTAQDLNDFLDQPIENHKTKPKQVRNDKVNIKFTRFVESLQQAKNKKYSDLLDKLEGDLANAMSKNSKANTMHNSNQTKGKTEDIAQKPEETPKIPKKNEEPDITLW